MVAKTDPTIIPHLGRLKALAERRIPMVSTEKKKPLYEALYEIPRLLKDYADDKLDRGPLESRQCRIVALLDSGGAFDEEAE